MSMGLGGVETPTSSIKDPVRVQFTAANETEILTPIDIPANKVAIAALPSNSGVVYIGNENVEVADGFPLEGGDAFAVSHDPSNDPFYGVTANPGDQVRVILLE